MNPFLQVQYPDLVHPVSACQRKEGMSVFVGNGFLFFVLLGLSILSLRASALLYVDALILYGQCTLTLDLQIYRRSIASLR
jgi:hypothetical protein